MAWMISLTSILALAAGFAPVGDHLQKHVDQARGEEPFAVIETITVTASQGDNTETSDPVEVRVERTPNGHGRLDLKGYSVFIDEEALSVVHESNDGAFVRVYDLQTSDRSSFYFRLFRRPKPEWSGIAAGCSLRHTNSQRDSLHTIERQREQLAMAGIDAVPLPNFD